ncbi:hypothetical protein BALU111458_11950 [Bacillus luti]
MKRLLPTNQEKQLKDRVVESENALEQHGDRYAKE